MTTVLVVDDSRLAREMVRTVIASLHADWTIVTAIGGDEALVEVERLPPDAALVDFNMPGMDGLTLAQRLKALFPTLPISILTANVQDSLRAKAESLGCAFIAKPITTDKIRTFLTEAGL